MSWSFPLRGRFAVADDPHVSGDARVVKHVGGEADDGFDQIVFNQVAADLALATPRTAGEQGGAVEHNAKAAAAIFGRAHFGKEMEQKKQRAIGDARQSGAKTAVVPLLGGFLADFFFDLLPLHAEGRIGEHVIKVFAGQAVGGERVAEDDVGDVLTLDQHVGFADGVGLRVQLLAVHDQSGIWIDLCEVFVCDAQHSASASGRIVEAPYYAGSSESVVILDEQEIDHQPDHFARGKMFSGGLIGQLGELADQLLEDRSHLRIADGFGVEVNLGEFFGDQVEQPCLVQAVDLRVEFKTLEDIAHSG